MVTSVPVIRGATRRAEIDEIGQLNERVTVQANEPAVTVVSSITRAAAVATVTTATAHGFTTGEWVTIAGADQADYNGLVKVTVTSALIFTYAVANAPVTPATGTITTTYSQDASGGRKPQWTTIDTVWARVRPLRGLERIQAAAVGSNVTYRVRLRAGGVTVTAKRRLLWQTHTLEIAGVVELVLGRDRFVDLDCVEVV